MSKPSAAAYPIVFTSDRNGSTNVYSIYSDGTRLSRLTTGPGPDLSPVWSPSGAHILYTSARDGHNQVYAMDADGANQTNLTKSAFDDSAAGWSPDGARIAFVRSDFQHSAVYVANAGGTGLINLSAAGGSSHDTGPAWSPNGRRIAFNQGGQAVLVVNSDGSGGAVSLEPGLLGSVLSAPTWSPDGQQIDFVSLNSIDVGESVYISQSDGTGEFEVAGPLLGGMDAPVWFPDGSAIVFDGNPGTPEGINSLVSTPNRQLFLVHLDGSGVDSLSNNEADDHAPALSPDGTQLVFSTNRAAHPDDLYIMNPAGGSARNLTADPKGTNESPGWSPHH